MLSGGSGKGILNGKDLIVGKPYTRTTTRRCSGIAYTLKAKVEANNNGTSVTSSQWATLSNFVKNSR